ncbi:MAG: S8 family serine peptidase [Bdellovibrionota bacterium]|nr:S8 family serine peptidase [Bdellovibrionota bacterium]
MTARNINRLFLSVSWVILAACSSENISPVLNETQEIGNKNYIVVFNKAAVASAQAASSGNLSASAVVKTMAENVGVQYGVQSEKSFAGAVSAAVYSLNSKQIQEMKVDQRVAYIEEDIRMSTIGIQENPEWGLDRIDQESSNLDDRYEYPKAKRQVYAYVVDTGVRISHEEFEGRAEHGIDTVSNDSDSTDCNGHGTHVAGTIGGKTYGVSKDVKIVGVRVLDCGGGGSVSNIVEALNWVIENRKDPAVVNMSLGGGTSKTLDNAIEALVRSGVTAVVAAGNDDRDACNYSPARVSDAITVGSIQKGDRRSSFSNYGECVDIFAPGSSIKSSWYRRDNETKTISGTSMASPHVAGVAALVLASDESISRPDQVRSAILQNASSGKVSDKGSDSPNLLLSTVFIDKNEDGNSGEEPVEPEPENQAPIVSVDVEVEGLSVSVKSTSSDEDGYVLGVVIDYGDGTVVEAYEGVHTYSAPGSYVIEVVAVDDQGAMGKVQKSVELSGPVNEKPAPCDDCDVYEGNLSGSGDFAYMPDGTYYYLRSTRSQRIYLQGPEDTDFDIYLYKWDGREFSQVRKSTGSGSEEKISYYSRRGYYLIKVKSKSGSGNYKLYVKGP